MVIPQVFKTFSSEYNRLLQPFTVIKFRLMIKTKELDIAAKIIQMLISEKNRHPKSQILNLESINFN